MKLSTADLASIGIVDYVDNSIPMTVLELSTIRDTLKLTQDGLSVLLGVSREHITRCECGKTNLKHACVVLLRLLVSLPEEQRRRWINVPTRKNRTRAEVDAAIEDAIFTQDKKALQRFKDNGYTVE